MILVNGLCPALLLPYGVIGGDIHSVHVYIFDRPGGGRDLLLGEVGWSLDDENTVLWVAKVDIGDIFFSFVYDSRVSASLMAEYGSFSYCSDAVGPYRVVRRKPCTREVSFSRDIRSTSCGLHLAFMNDGTSDSVVFLFSPMVSCVGGEVWVVDLVVASFCLPLVFDDMDDVSQFRQSVMRNSLSSELCKDFFSVEVRDWLSEEETVPWNRVINTSHVGLYGNAVGDAGALVRSVSLPTFGNMVGAEFAVSPLNSKGMRRGVVSV